MSTSDLISLASVIVTAFVAVYVLHRQLSSLNKQITLQNFADYTKRYQEIIQRFPEDINESDFQLNGREDYDRTMRAMRTYFDLCFEEWYLNQHKFIDPQIWEVWRGGMITAFSKPSFQHAWALILKDTKYGTEFEEFVSHLTVGSKYA